MAQTPSSERQHQLRDVQKNCLISFMLQKKLETTGSHNGPSEHLLDGAAR